MFDSSSTITVAYADGTTETFHRSSEIDARALASNLELETRVLSITINGEPFLNSEQDGLYLHRTGECSLCAAQVEGHCTRCGEATEDKNAEGGRVAGYLSVKPTHYHHSLIPGERGPMQRIESFHAILCYDCHRKDRLDVYGPTYGEQEAA